MTISAEHRRAVERLAKEIHGAPARALRAALQIGRAHV
jgi:hypothetical protein